MPPAAAMHVEIELVRSLMTAPPVTVPEDASASACVAILAREGYRHLPVVDGDGRLVGVLHDEALFAIETAFDPQDPVPDEARLGVPFAPARVLAVPAFVVVGPDAPLARVLSELAAIHDDLAVVVDDDRRPVGVVTEHDAVRLAARLLGARPTAREAASRRLVQVDAGEDRRVARAVMRAAAVRHVLVTRRGDLVGVLSTRDLLRQGWPHGAAPPRQQPRHQPRLGDLVGRMPVCVEADAPLRDAARWMAEQAVGCLPVLDEARKVVGVITRADVLAVLARDMGADVPTG